jgi:DNA-binding MarR family transcriptional regulator
MPDEERSMEMERRLGFLIHDVARLRRSAFDRCLKPLGMTRSQWWVLASLAREDGMTQTQLALELDLGRVGIGGLLDRLEKSGLIRRDPDPRDRRVHRVFLEAKSKQLITRVRKVTHSMNEVILADLTEADIETTIGSLDSMKHYLLAYLQASDA